MAPSPLFRQTGVGDTRAWFFLIRYSQSNHHKWDFYITRSKISYSLIEPQPPPSTLAYALNSMHLHSTHTPLLQHLWSDPHLKSNPRPVVEFFLGNSQRV